MSTKVFFSADDGVHGQELWVTDGTPEGTRLVRDLAPGPADGMSSSSFSSSGLTSLDDGRVIFESGNAVWASDGSESGTIRMGDIPEDPGSFATIRHGEAVFRGRDENGSELWISDGTPGDTALVKEFQTGLHPDGWALGGFPGWPTTVRPGKVVFTADDGVHGDELWVTDGTMAGTTLIGDLRPGEEDSDPHSFHQIGTGKVVFAADDGIHGEEPWITDGTPGGTRMLGDLFEGADDSTPRLFQTLPDGRLSFTADSGADQFFVTWVTDGTPEGTHPLVPLPGQFPGQPEVPTIPDPEPLSTGELGEFWTATGFPGHPEGDWTVQDDPEALGQLGNGNLLFSANTREGQEWFDPCTVWYLPCDPEAPLEDRLRLDSRGLGSELWITDGSQEGTEFVADLLPGSDSGSPSGFMQLPDGRALFAAEEGPFIFTNSLWVTDGTEGGTTKLLSGISNLAEQPTYGYGPDGRLITVLETEDGDGLWATDGTAEGTELLLPDAASLPPASSWFPLTGDEILVSASLSGGGSRTWATDGTAEGTRVVSDAITTSELQNAVSMEDGRYIFVRNDPATGREPWLFDANSGALVQLADVMPGSSDSNLKDLVAAVPVTLLTPVSTLFKEHLTMEDEEQDLRLSDYFSDTSGTPLEYAVTGLPDGIDFDPASTELKGAPEGLPGVYPVSVTVTNELGGAVEAPFDWTVVDTGLFKISSDGDWGRETPEGPILAAPGSVLTIGRKDGTAALFRVEPRDADTPVASIENGKITLDGNVFSEQVTTDKPLMQGGFTLDMATGAVSGFSDAGMAADHRLVDGLIDLKFDTVAIEADKITFDTDLAFGDSAGDGPAYSALSTSGAPLSVSFGADGLEFGLAGGAERWSPDPVEFDLGGGSSISIGFSDLGADYESATDSIYLSGKATVGWGGEIENGFDFLDNDSEQSLVIDLAGEAQAGNYFQRGDKYLKITNGAAGWDWDVVGEIKYEDKYEGPVPSNGLLVKELGVAFDTVQDAYSGSFKANIPLFFGLDLSAGLGFVSNPDLALNKISIGVDGLDYPVGTTGLFVQGGSFGLDNLAAADPDAGWTYDADITGTFGPDNDLVSSPLHGRIAGTVKETLQQGALGYILNGSVALDSKVGYFLPDIVTSLATPLIDYFGVDPADVTEFEILTATSSTELDFTKDLVQFDAAISLLDGVVTGAAQLLDMPFGADKDDRKITGSVAATLQIPEDFPLVGGMTRSGNARVEYSSDGDFSNDVAAFWGSISLPFGYVRHVGAELTFDGEYRFLGQKEIAKISSWPLDESIDLAILSARWEIAADDVALELIAPDGTVLTEADIAARDDIALVTDLNTQTARHVALQNPEAGIWDLRVADASGLGVVRYEASEILEGAVAKIESLTHDPAANQAEIVIDLEAGDAETVDVVIFAAAETGQVTGIELATLTMAAGDPDVTHVIDYDALGPGDWHIYTRTEAEGLAPGIDMHAAPVTIASVVDLDTGVQQAQHVPTGQQIISIEVTNNGDRPSQAGSLTIDAPEGMFGADPVPGHDAVPLEESRTELELPALAPGETFTVQIAVPAGAKDIPDTIFVEAWTPDIEANRGDNALAQGLLTDANHLPAGEVTLTGPVELGRTVGVDLSGLVEPDGYDPAMVAYQWLLDGNAITGATGATHDVIQSEVGGKLSVEISYTDDDGADETVLSAVHYVAGIPQILEGTPAPDTLEGGDGHDTIRGLESNDTLSGGAGDDRLEGGAGRDTALYSGPQASHTLTLGPGTVMLADRRDGGDGTDTLIDMELIDFDSGPFDPFDLTKFGGPTSLSQEDFESFIELYIAYFNRAPDAIGLNFWGTAFATGTSLEEMASLFATQPETLAAYPPGTTNAVFAETVYNNVLGRTPDQSGFDFWVGQLDQDKVSRDQFILEVLRGAKSPLKPEEGQDFVDQQLADRAYLGNKVDLGAYFAVHKGMSDVDNASAAMGLFDGSDGSLDTAVAAIDSFHTDALDPAEGEFLMPLIGVLDDPFAVA